MREPSSATSSSAFPYKPPNRQELLDLIEENERLKRENIELCSRFVSQKQEYEAEKASYSYVIELLPYLNSSVNRSTELKLTRLKKS